ncbi:MAG: hypothetical protein DRJ42_20275 [Deltaproteobacteria bacterium]|nr:MAG: hypothetical protein DRJ42_20275 [Deltaproteobacteria bacterium]
METVSDQERIIEALSAEESALRDAGVEMIADFLLDRRVAELVDVESVVALTLSSLTTDNVTRVVEEHLSPAWDRHLLRVTESGETVGDALPPEVKRKLEEIALIQGAPPAAWAKGAVDPKLVRELLAPVLQDTLLSFAKKLSAAAASGRGGIDDGPDSPEGEAPDASGRRGGIAGRLRKSAKARAEKLASVGKTVGKTVAGKVGAELDKRMASTAKEFSQGALRGLRETFRERIRSDEGRELVGQIQKQIIHRVFETDVAVLMHEIEGLPREELEALVGPTFQHNAARAIGRRVVAEEVRAFLDCEGDKTLRELAESSGVLDETRQAVAGTMDGLARELFRSPAFGTWLGDLLTN